MTDEQKEAWLIKNRSAHIEFERLCYMVAETGKKFSFKAVAEKLRWESYFSYDGKYKWSNSLTKYAGMKFLEKYPQCRNQVIIKGENK
jgi:hypothetical protein